MVAHDKSTIANSAQNHNEVCKGKIPLGMHVLNVESFDLVLTFNIQCHLRVYSEL